jgi:hypothetical protein
MGSGEVINRFREIFFFFSFSPNILATPFIAQIDGVKNRARRVNKSLLHPFFAFIAHGHLCKK